MGMFDWYEPVPPLACPRCAEVLDGWQGKDAVCGLWVFRQGHAEAHAQRVDPEHRSAEPPPTLPPRFEIHTACSNHHWAEAFGEAPDGTWTRTTLVTPPVRPTRGVSGRWSCPCCACFTLGEEPPGTRQICPVCWWEDDSAQFADPNLAERSNTPSLAHARREFLRSGAADPDHRTKVRPARADELA